LEISASRKGAETMKRKRISEEQIIKILKEADGGATVEQLCRTYGISSSSFYVWRKKYGGMDVSEARRLRELEEENRQLKRLVADLSLDNQVLKDINSKKW